MRRHGALMIVDAVSSFGGMDIHPDDIALRPFRRRVRASAWAARRASLACRQRAGLAEDRGQSERALRFSSLDQGLEGGASRRPRLPVHAADRGHQRPRCRARPLPRGGAEHGLASACTAARTCRARATGHGPATVAGARSDRVADRDGDPQSPMARCRSRGRRGTRALWRRCYRQAPATSPSRSCASAISGRRPTRPMRCWRCWRWVARCGLSGRRSISAAGHRRRPGGRGFGGALVSETTRGDRAWNGSTGGWRSSRERRRVSGARLRNGWREERATVAVVDINGEGGGEAAARAIGGSAFAVTCDIGDPAPSRRFTRP